MEARLPMLPILPPAIVGSDVRLSRAASEGVADDDAPTCSVAEALDRQSLFVNRVLAAHALVLLIDPPGCGSIGHAGAVLDLIDGRSAPLPRSEG